MIQIISLRILNCDLTFKCMILTIISYFEEPIYRKVFATLALMIFLLANLEKVLVVLLLLGLMNIKIGWSTVMDQVICLCCYLSKTDNGDQGGDNVFVTECFSNWKEKNRLQVHVRSHNSSHNDDVKKFEMLIK